MEDVETIADFANEAQRSETKQAIGKDGAANDEIADDGGIKGGGETKLCDLHPGCTLGVELPPLKPDCNRRENSQEKKAAAMALQEVALV